MNEGIPFLQQWNIIVQVIGQKTNYKIDTINFYANGDIMIDYKRYNPQKLQI